MLGVQTFSVCCLFLWGLIVTYPIIWIVNKVIPIRLEPQDEIMGCDLVEHYMGDENEKMFPPLDQVQIANMRINGAQVSFALPSNAYSSGSYKEFDTLGKRRSFHLNHGYEKDGEGATNQYRQQTTERL